MMMIFDFASVQSPPEDPLVKQRKIEYHIGFFLSLVLPNNETSVEISNLATVSPERPNAVQSSFCSNLP
jgi:hypothetical protein